MRILGIAIFVAGFVVPYPVGKLLGEAIACLVFLALVVLGLLIYVHND